MKKLKLKHSFSGVTGDLSVRGCRITGDSLTVPDMSYSIRDILQKFTKLPDIQNNSLVFDEDPDFDDPVITDFKDLSDIQERQLEFNWYKDVINQKFKKSNEDKKDSSNVVEEKKEVQ